MQQRDTVERATGASHSSSDHHSATSELSRRRFHDDHDAAEGDDHDAAEGDDHDAAE